MRGVRTPLLLVAALLGLGGCSAFFSANLFASLGPKPTPKASDYEGTEGLSKLAADLESPAIVEALASDAETTAAIQGYLVDTYGIFSGSLADADSQKAAVLYSELSLVTTGGDDVANNAVATVQAGITPGQSIREVLAAIIPSDILSDPTRFSAMMRGMIAANLGYQAFGQSIPPVPPGVDLGDIAQKSLTAHVADFVVGEVAVVLHGSAADAIDQIYRALNGQPTTIPAGYTVGDPYSSPPSALVQIVHLGLPPDLWPF